MASPSRRRRAPAMAVAVAVAAALVAAVAVRLSQDPAPQGDFVGDPPPCSLVSPATAERLTGRAEGMQVKSSCNWAGPGSGGDPQPVLQVQLIRLDEREARLTMQRTKEEPQGKMGPMVSDLSDFGDEAFSRVRYPSSSRMTHEVYIRKSNLVVVVRYAPLDIENASQGAYDVATEASAALGKGLK
ncbi:hypothetical protein AB0D54_31700 [Streptomyces xanthophaeus]|uniref:hypothetical protein n=1 Tax=Streptomyces xanthophaeus TaxID=67385 RepID=UPI003448A2C0